jgi:hypothetical protein
MWDTEVDIAVIGAGIGGLANAIATVDAGGEVLVADAAPIDLSEPAPVALRERVDVRKSLLLHHTADAETIDYFAAVFEGLLDAVPSVGDGPVPRRNARNLSQDEAFGRVETFVGSRLPAWAAQCVTSPYGLLYTSMRDWRTTSMKSDDGESIEVMSIGAMEWAEGFGESELRGWVSAQARERDIVVDEATSLDRIVFEEGLIVGVVLRTPDGPLAVRTRAGITLAPREQDAVSDEPDSATSGDRLHVCMVGQAASRFGRVELMATEPAAPSRPNCTGSRRQLREGMHDARQPSLDGWRCGKVNGYPALGQ